MRYRLLAIAVAIGLLAALGAGVALADKPIKVDQQGNEIAWASSSISNCTKIQSGELVASDGTTLTVGYDQWGYNYQAHMFKGRYCDSDRVAGGASCDVNLIMKWNDAWISNTDCDGDLKLDRQGGFPTYIGSGAWLTNHMWGEYDGDDGKVCKWEYFTKIIAAPEDAENVGGIWFAADGTEIGPVIWGSFATIQSVYNDPCGGAGGIEYLSPDHAGFGGW